MEAKRLSKCKNGSRVKHPILKSLFFKTIKTRNVRNQSGASKSRK